MAKTVLRTETVIRWRYPLLAVWSALLAVPAFRWGHDVQGPDWAVLRYAGRSLFGLENVPALHLYAERPDVQVGPPALALNGAAQWLFARHGGLGGDIAVLTVIIALGLIAVWALEGVAARFRPDAPMVALIAGVVLMAVWAGDLGGWGHIEDALALTGILVAARCVGAQRWWQAGLCAGLAVSCKPWAVMAVPVLLGLSQYRVKALGLAAIIAVVPWLPFLLADAHNVAVGHYWWPVVSGSGLHALGFGPVTPDWLRPVEFAVGFIAAAVVARRSWVAAPFAGVAVRVALDPTTWAYYGVGPVAVAALLDVTQRRKLPIWSLSAVAVEYVAGPLLPGDVAGFVRLGWALVVIAALVASRRPQVEVSVAPRQLATA